MTEQPDSLAALETEMRTASDALRDNHPVPLERAIALLRRAHFLGRMEGRNDYLGFAKSYIEGLLGECGDE